MSGQPAADPSRDGTPAKRVLRGIAALVTLLGLLIVVPVVLFASGGDPLPRHVPSPGAIGRALTTTDPSGHLFIGVALFVAWIAWLAFALSTLLEVAGRLRNRPAWRIPGLHLPQRAAAGLLTSIAMMLGTAGTAATAYAADAPPPPAVVQTVTPVEFGAVTPITGTVLVYQVQPGDNLGSIAQRFFGTFDDYRRIATANLNLITHRAGPDGPDHIEPGWQLRLPAGARDRGTQPQATGSATRTAIIAPSTAVPSTTVPSATAPSTTAPSSTAPSTAAPSTDAPPTTESSTAEPSAPAPSLADPPESAGLDGPTVVIGQPVAGPTDAPPLVVFGAAVPIPGVTVTPPAADGADHHASPELLIAASALATGVLGAHLLLWRRRRRPGYGSAHVAAHTGNGSVPEPEPEVAGTAAEFDRLDLALRDLLSLLGDRDGADLPDIMGSWLVDGAVHLMLTRPCPAPPAPWVAKGLMWTLPAHAPTHPFVSGTTAPLPALVTVGGQDDRRVFLDLERLGVVTIGGDPQGATNLLRHVGAELCQGIWSEGVTVGVAGFSREDTEQLVALGGGRVRASDSAAEALEGAARWIGEAHDRLTGLGVTDVLSGRVSRTPSDAARLSPYALLLAGPEAADLERLERLDAYLAGLGRGQIAIATTTQANLGRWPMHVDADRHVTMDFLDTRVPAVSLAGAELASLADAPGPVEYTTGRAPAGGPPPVGRHRMGRRQPVS